MTEHRVIVDALNIDYPAARVVNNLSFTLGNERLALVGESGSGKSMSARALMGLVRKPGIVSANRLNVLGNDLLTPSTPRWQALRGNGIATVLQDPRYAPNPAKNVAAQLAEALTLHHRLPRAQRLSRIHVTLRPAAPNEHSLPLHLGALSGGQKKRVFLARALAQDRRVILLDEPFTGVDATPDRAIIELPPALLPAGRSLLAPPHHLASIERFCDRPVLLDRTVLAQGPTAEVFTRENLERTFGGALRLFEAGQAEPRRRERA